LSELATEIINALFRGGGCDQESHTVIHREANIATMLPKQLQGSFSKVKEHKVLAADIPVVPLSEVQRKFWASGGLRPRLAGTRRGIRVVMRHSGQVPCRKS
jgi:hypothetical protein